MKEKYRFSYGILKCLMYPIYMLCYRPTVVNREVIPKDGPVIICSNHIHLFDQNAAILSNKRMIHYMAKKEHLDGKFGFLFKMAGCIRVDREIHDESAKKEAMSLLENGYVVGIFPEGTRNQVFGKKELVDKLYKYYDTKMSYKDFRKVLKDNKVCISQLNLLNNLLSEGRISEAEYASNILDIDSFLIKLFNEKVITNDEYRSSKLLSIKFGAVSLAAKTGAYIVPCAVTGDYKINNRNLTLTYGEPFKVDDVNNLEFYRKKLEDNIIDLLLK